jgi:hypothetical protein
VAVARVRLAAAGAADGEVALFWSRVGSLGLGWGGQSSASLALQLHETLPE